MRYTRMDKRDVMVAVSVYCKPVFFEPLTTREMAHRETSIQLMAAAKENPWTMELSAWPSRRPATSRLMRWSSWRSKLIAFSATCWFFGTLALDIGVVYTVPVEIKLFRNERFNFRYIFKLFLLLERLPPGPFYTVAGVRI